MRTLIPDQTDPQRLCESAACPTVPKSNKDGEGQSDISKGGECREIKKGGEGRGVDNRKRRAPNKDGAQTVEDRKRHKQGWALRVESQPLQLRRSGPIAFMLYRYKTGHRVLQ